MQPRISYRAAATHEEEQSINRLHAHGLYSWRFDGRPAAVDHDRRHCPCALARPHCAGKRTAWQTVCEFGREVLTGERRPDEWYRRDDLVAIVHYPDRMLGSWLTTALGAAKAIGVVLDIDPHWALHSPNRRTTAVILTKRGIDDLLRPVHLPAQHATR
ncbi:hypothetical protein [Actinokineospora bangkokensis]|uniref:Uncharacterized protein n=1 Tax=Actinokineospora bangkokensis TaxID=1193682 RepID=A0A1Q9LNR6_9PSEU|nr:hypothetical protein [Actinokineospora bangkokensis]OLR93697.1 hypothetical protein BJP25_15680 [Actinokineospora bangkokensis]